MPNDQLVPSQPQAVERQPATIYEVLRDLARDPAVDVARIAGLMDLQIKAEDRQAEREFNAAFARLQPKLPRVAKRGKISLIKDGVNKGTIKFCTIDDLDAAIRPLYTEEGFTLSFMSEACPTGVTRVGILRHAAGHSVRSTMQLPPDKSGGKGELQGYGSSMSFCDRYITRGLFNIIMVDEDNDGSSGGNITEVQQKVLRRAILTVGIDETKFLEWAKTTYGAKAISEIPTLGYRGCQVQIEAKYRVVLQNAGDDAQEIGYKLAKLWKEN